VIYNHTIGLAVPVLATALVGVLTPLLWIVAHPARLGLAITIVAPVLAAALSH
jgi:hypothetical protein